MTWGMMLLAASAYVLLGRLLVSLQGTGRDVAFAVLNVVAVYLLFFVNRDIRYTVLFAVYLGLVSVQYLTLRWWSERAAWFPWLAFLAPLSMLAAIRYIPLGFLSSHNAALRSLLPNNPDFNLSAYFIGLSYLAFRTSQLVFEVRNKVVPRPDFWQYMGFAFFAPTFSVGPINPYSQYLRAFSEADRSCIPIGRALSRILVGAVKFGFLGVLLNQLTYRALLMDGHPHHWVDLPIAAIAYYLYLYCNFSGFCDIAIGSAGLIGIPVLENFDNPFAARNLKDFWNRWHITLSHYMRDIVFSPLSKIFVHAFGLSRANHAIALAIAMVFLMVGVWHGVGWHYAAFGAMHALGVVANHYYTIILKNKLGKGGFAAYNRSPAVRAVAVPLTFCYVAASLFVFANDWNMMKYIFTVAYGR